MLIAAAIAILLVASNRVLDLLPVRVTITGSGNHATFIAGGHSQVVTLPGPASALQFVPVPPHHREYQIDGSDSTNNFTEDPAYFDRLASTPYYRFQAWLRDDASYSQWRNLVISSGGRVVTIKARPIDAAGLPLPPTYVISVDLHRMETPRALQLDSLQGGVTQLLINRNDKQIDIFQSPPNGGQRLVAKWYFPLNAGPALGENISLALRTTAIALVLVLLAVGLGLLLPPLPELPLTRLSALVPPIAAIGTLAAGAYVCAVLFDKEPHILDGISYVFQAKIFAAGALTAPAPAVPGAFPTPFGVDHAGRWFSMYTPGTAVVLAAGELVHLPWLVEPLLAAGTVLLMADYARRQFGTPTALLGALLMLSSPFVQLQSGTFMSHVPGMFFGTCVVYAVTRDLATPSRRWVVMAALSLGALLFMREMSAILYSLTIGVYAVVEHVRLTGWRRTADDALAAFVCFLIVGFAYLWYDRALTGSAFLLPRTLFSATENRYGFGVGVGFYGRHTPGGGFVNTDEELTSLSFILFGWPFYFSMAAMLLPFLLRRARRWDIVHGAIAGVFVLAYVGLYYHGIAFGPRYYFDGLPSFILLAARGFIALASATAALLAALGRSRSAGRGAAAAGGLLALLFACNLLYFEPRQIQLYSKLYGWPNANGLRLGSFVKRGLAGLRVDHRHAVVAVTDPGLYDLVFGPMNCPTLNCHTVFVYLPPGAAGQQVRAEFARRTWYLVQNEGGQLVEQALRPAAPPVPVGTPLPPVPLTWQVPPAATALSLSFDGSPGDQQGVMPIAGQFVPAAGRHGGGALIAGIGGLVYDHIAMDPKQGALGLWLQPAWDGNDGTTHIFLDLGSDQYGVRLSKDGANNLRFQIWANGVESSLGFGAANWKRGDWHHVAGIWTPSGQMTLYVDGQAVARGAVHAPPSLPGTVHVGADADDRNVCDCVVDEVIVARTPVAPVANLP